MNIWVYIEGLAVTVNVLVALCCHEKRAQQLALWIMAAFALGIGIERVVPVPEQMLCLAAVDGFLFFKFVRLTKEELNWARWPLSSIQLLSLMSHFLNLATKNIFHNAYYVMLDVLFCATLFLSFGASLFHGVEVRSLFNLHRGHNSFLRGKDRA